MQSSTAGDVFAVAIPVLFLIGIPGNIHATYHNPRSATFYKDYAEMVKELPRQDLAQRVPRDLVPEPNDGSWITVGWLLGAAHSGRIPAASTPPTPKQVNEYLLRLSLEQSRAPTAPTGCTPVSRTQQLFDVVAGQSFVVVGTVQIQLVGEQVGTGSKPLAYGASLFAGGYPHLEKNVGAPMTLRIYTYDPKAMLCGLSPSS